MQAPTPLSVVAQRRARAEWETRQRRREALEQIIDLLEGQQFYLETAAGIACECALNRDSLRMNRRAAEINAAAIRAYQKLTEA